jgi:hypothetical protein
LSENNLHLQDCGGAGNTGPAVFVWPEVRATMTNSLALVLGLFILGAIALDMYLYGTEHLIFLGKKLDELIEWMAFWR